MFTCIFWGWSVKRVCWPAILSLHRYLQPLKLALSDDLSPSHPHRKWFKRLVLKLLNSSVSLPAPGEAPEEPCWNPSASVSSLQADRGRFNGHPQSVRLALASPLSQHSGQGVRNLTNMHDSTLNSSKTKANVFDSTRRRKELETFHWRWPDGENDRLFTGR